jgi:hypothetical protein
MNSTNGMSFPIINLESLGAQQNVQSGSLGRLRGTLVGIVEKIREMILKIQNVVHMVFAELLGRLTSMALGFQSFSVCIEKLEETFCPRPVASPNLGDSIKQFVASLNEASNSKNTSGA